MYDKSMWTILSKLIFWYKTSFSHGHRANKILMEWGTNKAGGIKLKENYDEIFCNLAYVIKDSGLKDIYY